MWLKGKCKNECRVDLVRDNFLPTLPRHNIHTQTAIRADDPKAVTIYDFSFFFLFSPPQTCSFADCLPLLTSSHPISAAMAGGNNFKPKHGNKPQDKNPFSNNNNNKNNNNSKSNNSAHRIHDKEPTSEVKKAFASVVKGPSANGGIPKNMLSNLKGKPGKVMLAFKPSPQWYNNELHELEDDGKDHHMLETTLAQKTTQAMRLLEEENTKYDENPTLSSSDKNFVSTIMASGTLNDRVSALTLLVQESPLHTTKSLDKLMAMAEKKSRTEAVKSVESLKDLFIGGMLPDRKLKYALWFTNWKD